MAFLQLKQRDWQLAFSSVEYVGYPQTILDLAFPDGSLKISFVNVTELYTSTALATYNYPVQLATNKVASIHAQQMFRIVTRFPYILLSITSNKSLLLTMIRITIPILQISLSCKPFCLRVDMLAC